MTDRSHPPMEPEGGEDRSCEPADDVWELLGAYAVDAVDDLERARVERLIASDRAAADEAARLEDAAAALASAEVSVTPPAAAWKAISESVTGRSASGLTAPRPRRRRTLLVAAAAAAAAIIVVLGVGGALVIGRSDGRNPAAQFAAAIADPDRRVGTLEGASGVSMVVLGPEGKGFLAMGGLPEPPAGFVYQLWLLDSGTPVSLGVVETDQGIARFDAPPHARTLALSLERAPGAQQPTLPPVAVAELS